MSKIGCLFSVLIIYFITCLFFQNVQAQNITSSSSLRRTDYRSIFIQQKKLAESGDAQAQAVLGLLYRRGLGVEQNDRKAAKWLKIAAEKGNALAQYNLANILSGQNKNRDAIQWYLRSANQGNADSMYKLGVLIYNGQGVKKDRGIAIRWYKCAAVSGHLEAQAVLGSYYLSGIPGVLDKDGKEAGLWLSKAAAKGHPGAKIDLKRLKKNSN